MHMPKKIVSLATCTAAIFFLAACDMATEDGPIVAEKQLPEGNSGQNATLPDDAKNSPNARFAAMALECVNKQYPNKISHVLNSAEDVKAPQALFPAFYGCFDWHSSVHGHWSMVSLLKNFPELDNANLLRRILKTNITAKSHRINHSV